MSMDLYAQYGLSQDETFWAGSPGVLIPHQTNTTFGMYEFMLLQSGSAEAKIPAPGVANKPMFFTQRFAFCVVPVAGEEIMVETVVDWHNDRRTFQHHSSPCPIMISGQTSGNGTVGADGVITIHYSSKYVNSGIDVQSYFGEWSFQLFQLTPSSTDTVSTSITDGASISTAHESSSSTSTSVDASIPPVGNRSVVIGSAIAGAALIIVILVSFWFWRTGRRAKMEIESILAHGPLTPYQTTTSVRDHQRKSEPPQEEVQNIREKSQLMPVVVIGSPESIPQARYSTNQPAVIPETLSRRRPPSTEFSAAPPAYDSHSNANQALSPLTSEDEPGSFLVEDLLGDWAEENRDAVSYHLERRLRSGGYVPGAHPNSISPEVWLSRFAVMQWELAGLVELFERTNRIPSRTPTSTNE